MSNFPEIKKLYAEYHKMVFNLAIYYLQNTEDAEEITQDVFVSAYENLTSFRNQSSIKTWLYRITINKSLDFLKAKKTKKNYFMRQEFIEEHLPEISDNVFEVLAQEEEWQHKIRRLFQIVNQLPDNQKNVVILMKVEQKSQEETAKILDISVKAVESLYQRAKASIKKLY